MSILSTLRRLLTAPARLVRTQEAKVRDPRPRPEFYDGTERPSHDDPYRYARGQKATPAPPGAGIG